MLGTLINLKDEKNELGSTNTSSTTPIATNSKETEIDVRLNDNTSVKSSVTNEIDDDTNNKEELKKAGVT